MIDIEGSIIMKEALFLFFLVKWLFLLNWNNSIKINKPQEYEMSELWM